MEKRSYSFPENRAFQGRERLGVGKTRYTSVLRGQERKLEKGCELEPAGLHRV